MTHALIEFLELRRLFAAAPWGDNALLIRQDVAVQNHPAIDGAGQTIAIIDTGIDYKHPALGGGFGPGFKVVGGYDFFDDDHKPLDTDGHGTSVAGVAAALPFAFAGRHYAGIAPAANLVALRVTDSADTPAPDPLIIDALDWVIEHREEFGITVVNLSLGSEHFEESITEGAFSDEISLLAKAGVTVVAASGNEGIAEGPGVEYPAADVNVIAAGAVDEFDVITDYTERGPKLDMLAPGENVASTTILGRVTRNSGTSFSTPMIAGTAALLRQINPALTPKETLSILRASGSDNFDGDDELSPVTNLAFPRLDVESALSLAEERLPPSTPPLEAIGAFGNGNSIACDPQGVLHFAWFDSNDRLMKYATQNSSGIWSQAQIVDTSGIDIGQYISLALDHNGKPHVAFFDGARGDLKYGSLNGGTWDIETLDSKQSTGLYPSLAFDTVNYPSIAYYRKASGDLRLASFDGDWTIQDVDTAGDVGRSASLAIDSAGRPAIAYEDSNTGKLMFASRKKTSAPWQITVADAAHGVSFISLKFDSDDRPSISYYDADPADLKFAFLKSGKWKLSTIDSKGAVGLYSQLIIDPETDALSIVYYNRTQNALWLATGDPDSWVLSRLIRRGGRYASAALRPDATGISFSAFTTAAAGLVVGTA